jgi:hypothetical protein
MRWVQYSVYTIPMLCIRYIQPTFYISLHTTLCILHTLHFLHVCKNVIFYICNVICTLYSNVCTLHLLSHYISTSYTFTHKKTNSQIILYYKSPKNWVGNCLHCLHVSSPMPPSLMISDKSRPDYKDPKNRNKKTLKALKIK